MSNPILARELKTYTRSLRSFGLRTAFVALLSLIVIAAWASALREQQLVTGGIISVRNLPHLGRQLFSSFTWALVVLLVLIIPAYAGGGICVERERGTLELTLASQLRGRSLVWGKFAAAMVLALVLLAGSLPVMSVAFLLGGVSGQEVVWMVLLLVVTAAAAAALSLFWSSVMARTYTAVLATLITVALGHFLLPPLLTALFQRLAAAKWLGLVAGWQMADDLARRCDPFHALRELLSGAAASEQWLRLGPGAAQGGLRYWALTQAETPVFLIGLVVLLLKRTSARLHQLDVGRRGAWAFRLRRRLGDLVEPRPAVHRRHGEQPRWVDRLSNPVLAKELRGRGFGQPRWLAPAGYAGLLLVGAAVLAAPRWAVFPDKALPILIGLSALAALVSGVSAAASVAVEKERETLQLMVATPLHENSIIAGKLLAAVARAQPAMALVVPFALLAGGLGTMPWVGVGWGLLLAETLCLTAAAVGLVCSVVLRRTSHAVMVALVALVLVALGPLWLRSLGLMKLVGAIIPGRWPPWMGEDLVSMVWSTIRDPALVAERGPFVWGVAVVTAGVAWLVALAVFRRVAGKSASARPRKTKTSDSHPISPPMLAALPPGERGEIG